MIYSLSSNSLTVSNLLELPLVVRITAVIEMSFVTRMWDVLRLYICQL